MSSKVTTNEPTAKQPVDKVVGKTLVFDANAPVYRDLGICSTCNHCSTCMFLQSARHPIAFCEEFDDSSTELAPKTRTPASKPRLKINYGEAQEIGLCAACESKAKCIYRKPGRAIWDCQDYS